MGMDKCGRKTTSFPSQGQSLAMRLEEKLRMTLNVDGKLAMTKCGRIADDKSGRH